MRLDLQLIPDWIASGSRVLDLGCGDGTLLNKLKQDRQVDGLGIEIDPDHLNQCLAKGLNVVEQDLNQGLKNFRDHSFDVVVNFLHQAAEDPNVVSIKQTRTHFMR